MALAYAFNRCHDEWVAKGSPPCRHDCLSPWQDDPHERADGVGCTDCGRWFEDEWEAKRHAASGVAR